LEIKGGRREMGESHKGGVESFWVEVSKKVNRGRIFHQLKKA